MSILERFKSDRPMIFSAPMEGVSDPVFRDWVSRFDVVDIACTEFVRISKAKPNPKLFREALHKSKGSLLSVQVMGIHLEHMQEATRMLEDHDVDIVDINMGCPTPRAARHGVGAAMLKDVEVMSRVVSTMRESTSKILSVKMRAGFDESDWVLERARRLEELGVDFIAIHPRRGCDHYRGVADWRIIEAVASALTIPVIGNGDLWYAGDALKLAQASGVKGLMFGRPLLRNPWLLTQLHALLLGSEDFTPTHDNIRGFPEQLRTILLARVREKARIGRYKEWIRWFGKAFATDVFDARALMRPGTVDGILEVWHAQCTKQALETHDFLSNSGPRSLAGSPLSEMLPSADVMPSAKQSLAIKGSGSA